jgi:hypothetical protein
VANKIRTGTAPIKNDAGATEALRTVTDWPAQLGTLNVVNSAFQWPVEGRHDAVIFLDSGRFVGGVDDIQAGSERGAQSSNRRRDGHSRSCGRRIFRNGCPSLRARQNDLCEFRRDPRRGDFDRHGPISPQELGTRLSPSRDLLHKAFQVSRHDKIWWFACSRPAVSTTRYITAKIGNTCWQEKLWEVKEENELWIRSLNKNSQRLGSGLEMRSHVW